MTVTPMISLLGMRERSGASAQKRNLLMPTGTGPTRTESSSWSYSLLKAYLLALRSGGHGSGGRVAHEVAEPT